MKRIYGSSELLEDVQDKGICIGCGGCVDLCPYFKTYRGKTTMLFPCTLTEGSCYAYCPMAEVDLGELSQKMWKSSYDGSPLGHYRQILTSKAGKNMPSGSYQAGGTVSALMTFALEEGFIDAAVLTDRAGLVPTPKLVTEAEDVAKCAGSKFMASPTLAALNQGVKQGFQRMGVVGTPCQCLSVTQMRSNPLDKDDFIDPVEFLVGLFCTWAVDTRGLIPLLTGCLGDESIVGIDIPPPPSNIMVVHTEENTIEIPLDQIKPLIPHSCRICPDMTSEWSDVSVGVLEGKSDWNTLIIRTKKGAQLVDAACHAGYLITEEMPAENWQHLCVASANKKTQALIQAKEEGFLNTDEEGKHAVLRVPEDVVKRIMAQDTEEICRS
ncbi:Coenzyme F420 hydrogenase/dehydrogenase, beta subunit C-terminal domain [Acidobacteriota bacterium]